MAHDRTPKFTASLAMQSRFHRIIPGGSHTYAKGDDQYPEFMPPYIMRGNGSRVWDADGNEFIEYGSGLRAVTLGHAYAPVVEAARRQMGDGANFVRPAVIELQAAEDLLSFYPNAEMVKFGKNGSDATSAAIRVARAATGRPMVAICGDHPFFSVDDWFMGSTPLAAGVPEAVRALTVKFKYNDLPSLKALFDQSPGQIAAVILEPEKEKAPEAGFLPGVRDLCHANGAVFILDEMITGFRWHNGGGQAFHGVVPDLCTIGKGLGNGFAIAALAGKREIMKLGGFDHDRERVFLLSVTHGAETHALSAARAVMQIYRTEPVVNTLWERGERLANGLRQVALQHNVSQYVEPLGRPCCLVFTSRDAEGKPSQPLRTLLIQELMKRGILAPSLVVGYSHTNDDIDRTIEAFGQALAVYRNALDNGIDRYLEGRPVKPVFRTYN